MINSYAFCLLLAACLIIQHSTASTNCVINNATHFIADTQSLYFTKEPTDVTFLNTKSAKVECKANGSPKATISWQTVDGKAAKNISGIRHILLDGSLEFPTFAPGDFKPDVHATQYRCLAQNKIGKLQSKLIRVKAGTVKHSISNNNSNVPNHYYFGDSAPEEV